MLDGWFCRTVANQKSMDQIDQDEDAQSDSQEGKETDCILTHVNTKGILQTVIVVFVALSFLHTVEPLAIFLAY